jgi:hypothetical protein
VRIGAILEPAEKTGALDENALAELPAGIADRLRAVWTAAPAGSGHGYPRRLTNRVIVLQLYL